MILFYNENDDICLKLIDGTYKLLYDNDIFQLGDTFWKYHSNFFYIIATDDEDMYTDWNKKVHPRNMNIVEMEEAFPPMSYKERIHDRIFKEGVNLSDDEDLLKDMIALEIEYSTIENTNYATYNLSNAEYDIVGQSGLYKVLSLLDEDYSYEIDTVDAINESEDYAIIKFFWL